MRTIRSGEYFAAVYGIIRNVDGEILMQRRANTGFNDGALQLPSGHIEGAETYFEALKREMKEEIGIDIESEKDVKLVHVLHRIHYGDRVYYDIFFEIKNYFGTIENTEPDKCSELEFYSADNSDFTQYNKTVLKLIEQGISLSEITT